ncbi:MAG: S8 family serine peptidase, partial [Myxococcota bacterium]
MTDHISPVRDVAVRAVQNDLPIPARARTERRVPIEALTQADRTDAARPDVDVAANAVTELAQPGSVAARSGARTPLREFIVFLPQNGELAASRSTFTDGVLRSMRANQTEAQRALSSERRGRYVALLSDAQVENYRTAGLRVFENVQVSLPRPVEGQATTTEFRPNDEFSNPTHGVDALQEEPGWLGAGVLYIGLDTGSAEHPDNAPTVLFDDIYTPSETDPQTDGHGHGTHTDGIGRAQGDNVTTARGVAPEAIPAHVKVLTDSGSGTLAGVIAGVERAIEWANRPEYADKPVVANMSLGAYASGNRDEDPLAQIVNEAVVEHGIFMSVSAGNSGPGLGTVGTPGVAQHAATIAATDHWDTVDPSDDEIASFSSRGDPSGPLGQSDKPDLAAGGVFVNSTVPGGGYARWSGTSMAAPQVTGAAAVLLGRAQELYDEGMFRINPREMVRSGELLAIMQETAFDLPDPSHADGAGDLRLNAAAELMLERHSLLHIVEREIAFREMIENLEADDGQLDSR